MILYPKEYFEKITDIDIEFLNRNKIKAMILDVDNTLIDTNRNMLVGIEKWVKKMKNENIKFCILSNSNKIEKIKTVSEILEIPYFYFAKKPLKGGFYKAIRKLNEKNENIAVVGDQIFTDVLGANRVKMYSILVKPISKKDIWITVLKRPIENLIIKKFKMKYGR